MHGLTFETSVWLLAESTRLLLWPSRDVITLLYCCRQYCNICQTEIKITNQVLLCVHIIYHISYIIHNIQYAYTLHLYIYISYMYNHVLPNLLLLPLVLQTLLIAALHCLHWYHLVIAIRFANTATRHWSTLLDCYPIANIQHIFIFLATSLININIHVYIYTLYIYICNTTDNDSSNMLCCVTHWLERHVIFTLCIGHFTIIPCWNEEITALLLSYVIILQALPSISHFILKWFKMNWIELNCMYILHKCFISC